MAKLPKSHSSLHTKSALQLSKNQKITTFSSHRVCELSWTRNWTVLLLNIAFISVGISGKSQVLFALVFTTRYLDLFTVFISPYNTVMKVRVHITHSANSRAASDDCFRNQSMNRLVCKTLEKTVINHSK